MYAHVCLTWTYIRSSLRPQTVGATFQTGQDNAVRSQFINNGKLSGTKDTNFRAIQDNWPVFALAHDLGSVTGPSTPVLYSVGHIRDPAVQYITANNGRQDRSLYFWTAYSSPSAVVSRTDPSP